MSVGWRAVAAAVVAVAVGSCGSPPIDSGTATAQFADCLARHGIEFQDLEVRMADGDVEGISAVILSEGDIPYEPVARTVCALELTDG